MRRRFAAVLAAAVLALAACSEQAGLSVTAVTPVSGGPGTELSVTGSGLAAGTSVAVCGVPLDEVSLTVEERKAAGPGTVGTVPGAATLAGLVPDLGATADCGVVVVRPDGATATWTGTFAFVGAPAGPPGNQAPTTDGLPDVVVAGAEAARVIDLAAAFADADDGVDALVFKASLDAPAGNVTADVSGSELTLGFTSRSGVGAEVVVTATDPQGASVDAGFEVTFEGGIVTFEAPDLTGAQLSDMTVVVTHADGEVGSFRGDDELPMRAGEYTFTPTAVAGTFVDRRLRGDVVATVNPASDTLVTLPVDEVAGSGRLWLPVRLDELWSLDDAELASGGVVPSATATVGNSVSALAVAPDGSLWAGVSNEIWRVDPSELGKPVPVAALALTAPGLSWVSNLVFDQHGNLWIAEFQMARIQMFTAAQVASGGEQVPTLTITSADGHFNGPGALEFDAAGNLWVGTTNGGTRYIHRFDAADLDSLEPRPSLTITAEWSATRHFGIAFDPAGDLWYTTDRDYVGRVPAGSLTATGHLTDDARLGLQLPEGSSMGLSFDSRGNLWVLNRSGVLMTVMADELDASAPSVATLSLEQGFDIGRFVFFD